VYTVYETWFFYEFQLFVVWLDDSKCFPQWRQQTGSGLLNRSLCVQRLVFLIYDLNRLGQPKTIELLRENTFTTPFSICGLQRRRSSKLACFGQSYSIEKRRQRLCMVVTHIVKLKSTSASCDNNRSCSRVICNLQIARHSPVTSPTFGRLTSSISGPLTSLTDVCYRI